MQFAVSCTSIGYQMFRKPFVSNQRLRKATTGPNGCSARSATESKLWLEGGFEVPPMDQKRFHKFAEKFPENLRALRGDSLPRSNSLHNGKGNETHRA